MSEDKKGFGTEEPEITEERPRDRTYTREGFEEAGAGFLQALGDGLGVLFDRGRTEIETVARSSKARYDLIQAERDRDKLFQRLGREVYEMVLEGEFAIEQVQQSVEDLDEAHRKIDTCDAALKAEGEG